MPVWKTPPKIKIYEALGCLADQRLEIDGLTAKIFSSSRGKHYTVTYSPVNSAIMTNDNGSYWQGYLGYPAIAYLLAAGVIPHDTSLPPLLADIKWKDINTKFKNDWEKTEQYCHQLIANQGGNLSTFLEGIDQIHSWLESHPLDLLGAKTKPPSGY